MTLRRALGGMAGAVLAAVSASAAEPPRTLFLLLDAVPFDFVTEVTDPERPGGPLLATMSRPAPFVSTFPSSTSVAAAGILEPAGLEPSPGYEARFFDWERRRARGGGPISYFKIDFPWRDFFDWEKKGVARSAVGALRPIKASLYRVEKAVAAFLESDDPLFFAYVEATDTAIHLKGPRSMEPVFAALDRELAAARRRRPDLDFRVVLFSDHGISGGEPLANVWRPVRRALKEAGFRLGRRLKRPRDAVLTPFGLVSSFEVYLDPAVAREAAEVLATVSGVDLCVVPADETAWWVEGREGAARLERLAAGEEWRYRPHTGDPLDYAGVVARLAERSGRPSADRFPDAWWREATAGHRYPDALYRIARGFDLVTNPASVLCSLEPGHMYGAAKTEVLARLRSGRLRWTHGALHSRASLGFLMTDEPGWKPTPGLRFDRGLLPFLPAEEASR